jgi:hypothetical protein
MQIMRFRGPERQHGDLVAGVADVRVVRFGQNPGTHGNFPDGVDETLGIRRGIAEAAMLA